MFLKTKTDFQIIDHTFGNMLFKLHLSFESKLKI